MLELLRSEANRYPICVRTDLAAGLPKSYGRSCATAAGSDELMLNGIEAMKDRAVN